VCGDDEKCIQQSGKPKGKNHLGDLAVDGGIKKCTLKNKDVDCIHLAHDRVQWRWLCE
jgi:hypothetical protein